MTVITKAPISRKFPVRRGAPQVLYLLEKKGPQTIWQLCDNLTSKGIPVTWTNVQRTLHRLREKEHVGVVNWTEEQARHKRVPRYAYGVAYGEKKRGKATESAEVWGLVKVNE